MKKRLATLLLLVLTLALAHAYALPYTSGDYYSIDYPDTCTLDDTTHTEESTEDNQWLYTLTGEDYLIDAALTVVEEYQGFSHFSATDAQKAHYLEEVLSSFADSHPAFADMVNSPDGIPFYIFSLDDGDGMYYYAETIANGVSINFCCYYADASAVPDTMLLYRLEALLRTFRPVVAEEAGEDS